jgi:hypothetical protein
VKKLAAASLASCLFLACIPGVNEILVDGPTSGRSGDKNPDKSTPDKSTPDKPAKDEQAFGKDFGTVLLTEFNGDAKDAVSGDTGVVTGGSYPPALFGNGLKLDPASFVKPICRFAPKPSLSLSRGSIEALVHLDAHPSWFSHVMDKSWQYGLSDFQGIIAVHFGGGWWYSHIPFPLEKWAYVAATYDGATLKLYVNGTLAESTAYTGGEGDASWGVGIGNAYDDGYNIPFLGTIDALRLSQCARTAQEIGLNWKKIAKKL